MNGKVSRYTRIALLSAVAFVLQFFEFSVPIPLIPTFLKLDASDIPAVFAVMTTGGISGIVVQLIKNILHSLFFGWSGGLGELSNLIVGAGLVLPYLIAKKKEMSAPGILFSGIVSIPAICAAAFASNSVITPVYMGVTLEAVMGLMPGIMLFNLLKAVLVLALVLILRGPMMKMARL